MKTKTILALAGGILVILAVLGAWWYFSGMTEEMPGMSMGSPPRAEQMEAMDHSSSSSEIAQTAVMLNPARRQLIGVKAEVVQERILETVIRTVGTVDYDERRIRQINLRVPGWITELFVDYTGKSIKKGDPLFALYSPDLLSTQEEYILAKRTLDRVKASPVAHIRTGAEAQVESARNRLLLWNLTEGQIAQLETKQKPEMSTLFYSPLDGIVIQKMVLQGMYVTPEMNLYEIADLSVIWIYADIYEYEMPLVKTGQEVTVTLASYPGETFRGRLVYVYPYLNTDTRTIKVRMEFPNPQRKLKPGMYGNVEIRTKSSKQLAIPQESVLDSGTRKIVFVDKGQGMYEPREVKLGNKANNLYPVLEGLAAGEKVVTSATFLIDSESKLMAAANMMGLVGMGGIRMEQAQMGEMEMAQSPTAREQTVDGFTLTFATKPDPPKKGENLILLTVRSKEGPVTDAKVNFAYSMAMPGMEVEKVPAKHTQDGTYEATVDFGMKGTWDIDVTIVRDQAKPIRARFTINAGK